MGTLGDCYRWPSQGILVDAETEEATGTSITERICSAGEPDCVRRLAPAALLRRQVSPLVAPSRAAPATSSPANANRRADASAAAREHAPGRGLADAGGRGGIFGPRERMGWTRWGKGRARPI